jgi:hypothetical protein
MEETTDFTLPVIHLNGTGADTLYNEYRDARRALSEAADKLLEATCHPRDFYPVEGSWEKAKEERTAMIRKLDDVYMYLEGWENRAYQNLRRGK